jgi:hypothetical protein
VIKRAPLRVAQTQIADFCIRGERRGMRTTTTHMCTASWAGQDTISSGGLKPIEDDQVVWCVVFPQMMFGTRRLHLQTHPELTLDGSGRHTTMAFDNIRLEK